MKRKTAILLVLGLLSVTGVLSQPGAPPHRVYGNITNSEGGGVVGVNVSYRDSSSNIVATENTSSGGFYDLYLSGLSEGDKVYLFVNGSNVSKYVEFAHGSSERRDYRFKVDLKADFTVDKSQLNVTVDGGPSEGTVSSYEWDWTSDGTYDETGENASHIYDSGGDYQITLKVTGHYGGTDTYSQVVSVSKDTSDGGGGGGGGNGGDGGSPSGDESSLGEGLGGFPSDEPPEPKQISVVMDGRSREVGLGELEENQSVQVSVSGSAPFTGFSFVSGSGTENASLGINIYGSPPSGASQPNGTVVYRYFLTSLTGVESFRSSDTGFEVSKSWLNSRNRSSGDVAVYSYSGSGWEKASSSIRSETLNSYVFSTSSGPGLFAVGVPEKRNDVKRPDIVITDVRFSSSEEKKVNVEATAEVSNRGDASGSKNLYLYLDSEIVAQEKVSLAPGETRTVNLNVNVSEPGTHTLKLGSATEKVSVETGTGKLLLLLGAGGGVLLLISALVAVIYIRESRRARELEEKIDTVRRASEEADNSVEKLLQDINRIQQSLMQMVERERGDRQRRK
ncbi:MAG: CARDB domain-containing protein [Candidatus Nanosalina sp.]